MHSHDENISQFMQAAYERPSMQGTHKMVTQGVHHQAMTSNAASLQQFRDPSQACIATNDSPEGRNLILALAAVANNQVFVAYTSLNYPACSADRHHHACSIKHNPQCRSNQLHMTLRLCV